MKPASENKLISFLDQVIEALTVSDAQRLRDLLAEALLLELQSGKHEVYETHALISRRDFLAALLAETSRNLRVLKRACGPAGAVTSQPWRRRLMS
ncbi:MAG TPA: hypothetical protein VE178_21700 [Silvibacterium sp.]|jgi:hypothetical protein|nr:hypothetical protein [Silvibacterium sp.]